MTTLNQKRVFDKIQEQVGKGRKVSVSRAMKGIYSDSVAKNPKKLTKSRGWQQLLDKHIPDSKLMKVLSEGLDANKIISANISYGDADEKTNDFIEVPDHFVRHKYLVTGLEMKGRASQPDTPERPHQTLIIINPPNGAAQVSVQPIRETVPSVSVPDRQ